MTDINGYDNEFEFVKYLNKMKIKDLNPMFRGLIEELFNNVKDEDTISSWRNHLPQKSDIFIKINGVIRGVSIKKGMKNSVHVDGISNFIHFLIENKVPRDIVIEYLKYHYADGTTNGKGEKRLSAQEYKMNNQENIDKINKFFNQSDLLNKAIDRFVLKGNNSNYSIDALVYGEVDDFIWILKEDIKTIIMSKKDECSTAIHFGSLTCQPKNRCLNHNPLYEKDRFCVQVKWYNISDEIIEFMNNSTIKSVLE